MTLNYSPLLQPFERVFLGLTFGNIEVILA